MRYFLRVVPALLAVASLLWVTGSAFSTGVKGDTRVSASATHEVIISDVAWPATLNPLQLTTGAEAEQLGLTQPEGDLAEYGPKGKLLYPELTGPPQVSSDHLTITFELKHDMAWSDGTSITNNDYLFAWHVLMDPLTGPACLGTCDNVLAVSLEGNYSVVVHMKGPYGPELPSALVGILPHSWNVLGTESQLSACLAAISGCDPVAQALESPSLSYTSGGAVTAGPYKVSSYTSQAEIDYTPNPNFSAGMGYDAGEPTSVKFLFYPDIASMVAAADSHAVDVTEGYSLYAYYQALRSDPNFTTVLGRGAGSEALIFNALDKRVDVNGCGHCQRLKSLVHGGPKSKGVLARAALSLAVSYAGLLQDAYGMSARDAQQTVSYCAPLFCSANDSVPFNDRSKEKGVWDPLSKRYTTPGTKNAVKDARRLWHAATAGKPEVLYLSAVSGDDVVAEEQHYIQAEWESAFPNLRVKLAAVPANRYYDDAWSDNGTLAHGNFETAILALGGVGPDPDSWKNFFLGSRCMRSDPNHSALDMNYGCFRSSAIDSDLAKGSQAFGTGREHPYRLFQQQVSKAATWRVIAPIPDIWTTDGKPAQGFERNPWVVNATWDSQGWRE